MKHEDTEVAKWLTHLDKEYVSVGVFLDEHGCSIRIHGVYGGHSEYFFLMEWEDTQTFFSIKASEGILIITRGLK